MSFHHHQRRAISKWWVSVLPVTRFLLYGKKTVTIFTCRTEAKRCASRVEFSIHVIMLWILPQKSPRIWNLQTVCKSPLTMRSASFKTWQLVSVVPSNCSACTGFSKPKHPFVSRARETIPGRPLECRIMVPQYVLPDGATHVSSRIDSGTFRGVSLHFESFKKISMFFSASQHEFTRVGLEEFSAFYDQINSCSGSFSYVLSVSMFVDAYWCVIMRLKRFWNL